MKFTQCPSQRHPGLRPPGPGTQPTVSLERHIGGQPPDPTGRLREECGPQHVAPRQLQGPVLHPQGLAVEGEAHLKGQPIHKAVQEPLGRRRDGEDCQLGGWALQGRDAPSIPTPPPLPKTSLQSLQGREFAEAPLGPP